jgi:glycosidase
LEAALYWIRECDIDAWRLDVANEVSFDFWREFSQKVRDLKKDFYIVGEICHDASPWINSGVFNASMNYPLGFAVIDFFLKKSIGPEEFTNRIACALSRYSDLHNKAAFNLLDSHDTVRSLTTAGGDKLALKNAFTMLLLLPGSPCVYYGTEIGMSGGPDPLNRRPFVWNEAKQDRDLLAFFKKLIAFRRLHADFLNAASFFYRSLGSARLWTLGSGGEKISVVYAGEKPFWGESSPETGKMAFCTADSAVNETGELPPYSIGVYSCF